MLSTRRERKIHKFANNESNFVCCNSIKFSVCNGKTNYFIAVDAMHATVDVASFLMQMSPGSHFYCDESGKWRWQCWPWWAKLLLRPMKSFLIFLLRVLLLFILWWPKKCFIAEFYFEKHPTPFPSSHFNPTLTNELRSYEIHTIHFSFVVFWDSGCVIIKLYVWIKCTCRTFDFTWDNFLIFHPQSGDEHFSSFRWIKWMVFWSWF